MTIEFLRNRLVRILMRPPEIIYALARHWMLCAFLVLLGVAGMWIQLIGKPFVYQGHAQLLVDPTDPAIAMFSPSGMSSALRTPRDMRNLLEAQQEVLMNESVLEKLVVLREQRGVSLLAPTREWGAQSRQEGDEELSIGSIQRKLMGFLRLSGPKIDARDREAVTMAAVKELQRRISVELSVSGTLDLYVYGALKDMIALELTCWIEAYRDKVHQMAREGIDGIFKSRTDRVLQEEKDAAEALDRFTEENPDFSMAILEDIDAELSQLRTEKYELERRIDTEDFRSAVTAPSRPPDPEYQSLIAQKHRLEVDLMGKRAEGYPDTSSQVRALLQQLEWVGERLEAFPEYEPEISSDDGGGVSQRLQDRLDAITTRLNKLLGEKIELGRIAKRYQDLEERLQQARENRQHLGVVLQEAMDVLESQRTLKVKVSNEPTVDVDPYNYRPLRMLGFGALGGLFAGLVLCVLLEVLCGKVRFKHDLIDDFGLPVIAVFSK